MSTLMLGSAGVTIGAVPASATVTTLCSGYTACANAGMSNSGYSTWRNTMYWRMYSGHNCTNYAAYRMIQAGLPNVRPWTGSGNATNWGHAMSRITDSTPSVGAVAWWKAGVRPAGSAGHVAYVEKVVSANEIIVSQDSWNGDFSWTRVTRTSSGWPSGFIHFKDVSLRNTVAPTIKGTARVGSVLSASPGTWNPTTATVSYQWLQNGTAIAGATAATLTLKPAQQGKRVTVRVTAGSLGLDNASADSAPTATVAPVTPVADVPVTLPTIELSRAPELTGRAKPGRTLTLVMPTLPQGTSVAVQWLRAGVDLPGATRTSHRVTTADIGSRMRALVRLSRPGHTSVTRSTSPTRLVRATPAISVAAKPGEGTMLVGAKVRATGVDSVNGTLQVRSQGKLIGSMPVQAGLARATFTKLPRGTRTYRFWFLTTSSVSHGVVAKRVTIG